MFGLLNLPSIDSSIRVRDLDGNELIEVFQSTILELTARTLFFSEIEQTVILEARIISGVVETELQMLVRTVQPCTAEMNNAISQRVQNLSLTVDTPVYISLELTENIEYTFDLIIDGIATGLADDNFFAAGVIPGAGDGDTLVLLVKRLLDAVSFRLYAPFDNSVVARDQTALVEENTLGDPLFDDVPGVSSFEIILAEGNSTLTFTPTQTSQYVLEISYIFVGIFFVLQFSLFFKTILSYKMKFHRVIFLRTH